MLGALNPYHPSVILKEKRERLEKIREGLAALTPSEGAASSSSIEDANIATGPAAEALSYLEGVNTILGEIDTKVQELLSIATSSVKNGSSDAEQKTLNKQFQAKKKELDLLAKTSEVKREAPLSGRFANKPKVFPLGEGAPPLEMKIDPFHSAGLRLDSLRVDSLSYAKKAKQELERAKETVSSFKSTLGIKMNGISAKLATVASSEVVSKQSVTFTKDYGDLKSQQERAARAKGRTFGLLVNIKV